MAGDKDADPFLVLILIVASIAIFCWVIWYVWGDYILEFLRWLCISEAYILDVFVNDTKITEMKTSLVKIKREDLEIGTISEALFVLGSYTKYLFGVLVAFLGYKAFKHQPTKILRNKMGMEDLIKFQAKAWPYITPFVNYDPGKDNSRQEGVSVPSKLKPFAEALSPIEWLVFHDISVDSDYKFNEKQAEKVMASQLGRRWRGVDELTDSQKALFAAFSLKGARKREESDDFLGKLSLCWSIEKGFVMTPEVKTLMNKILNHSEYGKKAERIANNHAYVSSAILGVLDWARQRGGVLAPAQFVWLRGQDRNLWYALNSLGRKTYFTEGSGAINHYYIEKGLKKPLRVINVDNAIKALKDSIYEECPDIPVKE